MTQRFCYNYLGSPFSVGMIFCGLSNVDITFRVFKLKALTDITLGSGIPNDKSVDIIVVVEYKICFIKII